MVGDIKIKFNYKLNFILHTNIMQFVFKFWFRVIRHFKEKLPDLWLQAENEV